MDYKTIANDGIVEEEIKKFHPSLEIGEVEEAIYNHDLTDLTDLLVEIEKNRKPAKSTEE